MLRTQLERIHRLTTAVPSLERALSLWRDALGVSPDIRECPEHHMREAAFPLGRRAPAPRTRGARPHLPPVAATPVKTARAPRPPVRPRGPVRRGGKK